MNRSFGVLAGVWDLFRKGIKVSSDNCLLARYIVRESIINVGCSDGCRLMISEVKLGVGL